MEEQTRPPWWALGLGVVIPLSIIGLSNYLVPHYRTQIEILKIYGRSGLIYGLIFCGWYRHELFHDLPRPNWTVAILVLAGVFSLIWAILGWVLCIITFLFWPSIAVEVGQIAGGVGAFAASVYLLRRAAG